jgi:hypothetical protein
MLLSPPDHQLTRDEAARLLSLDRTVINALVASGSLLCHVRDGKETIPSAQFETLFRDSLLRLYHAQAVARRPVDEVETAIEGLELEVPATVGATPEPIIGDDTASFLMRSIGEAPVDEEERPNLRIAPRYIPRKQLSGAFREIKFTILQISATGMRIRHEETLLPGEEARLTFAMVSRSQSFVVRARVVWTSIAQRDDAPSFCISGVRVTQNADQLRRAVELLREAREVEPERITRRKSAAPSALTGLSDDDVAAIIRAVRHFTADPVEASRWYSRARFSLSEEQVRQAAPTRARDREEVVGIWEYLDRRMDLKAIAGVITWMRNARTTATADA